MIQDVERELSWVVNLLHSDGIYFLCAVSWTSEDLLPSILHVYCDVSPFTLGFWYGVTFGFTSDFFIGLGFHGLNSVQDPHLMCFSVTLIQIDFAVRTAHRRRPAMLLSEGNAGRCHEGELDNTSHNFILGFCCFHYIHFYCSQSN
jgi:hypothetical protein